MVPDNPMRVSRFRSDDLKRFIQSGFDSVTLLAAGIAQTDGGIAKQSGLAIFFGGGTVMIGWYRVVKDIELGKIVTVIGIAEVARFLDKTSPTCEPDPESTLLVGIEREIVCFGGVAFEESG